MHPAHAHNTAAVQNQCSTVRDSMQSATAASRVAPSCLVRLVCNGHAVAMRAYCYTTLSTTHVIANSWLPSICFLRSSTPGYPSGRVRAALSRRKLRVSPIVTPMFREARGSVPLAPLMFRVAGSGCSKVVFKLLVPLTFCVAPGVAVVAPCSSCVDEGVVTGVSVAPGCSKVVVAKMRVAPSFRVAPGVPT